MKAAALILVFLLNSCCCVISPSNGSSMFPAMQHGDIWVYRHINKDHKIERGDIVSFHKNEYFLCKRVIGLPGEKISLKWKEVYINDVFLREPNIAFREDYTKYTEGRKIVIILGEDEYYIMGDNRQNSLDSRDFGPIKRSEIVEKVLFRLWRK